MTRLGYTPCDAKALKIVSIILRLKEDEITILGFEEAEPSQSLLTFSFTNPTWKPSPFVQGHNGHLFMLLLVGTFHSSVLFIFPHPWGHIALKEIMWIFYFFWNTTWKKRPKSQQDHVVWQVTANSASNVTYATMPSPTHQPCEAPSLLSPLFWTKSIFWNQKLHSIIDLDWVLKGI